MSHERLWGGEGSLNNALGVSSRTCRQPVCAGSAQSGLFHILQSHLLSVLPEAIVLSYLADLSGKKATCINSFY